MSDPSENRPAATHDPPKQDWVLQSLVSMVNGTDLEIGVILTVRGILISGNLVSGHLYFDEFNSELELAFQNEDNPTRTESAYRRFRHIYPTPASEEDSELPPAYVHLKHAKLFHPIGTAVPGDRGVWWRGRICEVDGFSLGRLPEQSAK